MFAAVAGLSGPSMEDSSEPDWGSHFKKLNRNPGFALKCWARELGDRLVDGPEVPNQREDDSQTVRSNNSDERCQRPGGTSTEKEECSAEKQSDNLASSTRQDLQSAKKLQDEGLFLDSMLRCGLVLRREMAAWLPSAHMPVSRSMKACLLQLLSASCHKHPEIPRALITARRMRSVGHREFLGEVVKKLVVDTNDTASAHLACDISGYVLVSPAYRQLRGAQWFAKLIWERLHDLAGPDDAGTKLALKYLAESYACHDDDSNDKEDAWHIKMDPKKYDLATWAEQEEVIRRHVEHLENDLGQHHPDALRFRYAQARATLAKGDAQTAKQLLRRVFDARVQVFGEDHSESGAFIDDGLQAYCEERAGGRLSRGLNRLELLDSSMVDMLVEFGLCMEAYDEVDVLVRECVFEKRATNRDSPNKAFASWYQFEMKGGCRVQARLASHNMPNMFYWEDSRMYFRSLGVVNLVAAYPDVPIRELPAKILVTADKMEIKVPCGRSRSSHTNYEDVYGRLGHTEIWHLLDRKRRQGYWKILLAFENQGWDSECEKLAEGPVAHEFYVFPDAMIPYGDPESVSVYRHSCLPNTHTCSC